jgi:electron transfer flavoprotein alpha subunit
MSNTIFVIAEQQQGKFDDITFEMLGKGRELATALDSEVVAVLAGHSVKDMAGQLGAASKVICIDSPALANFSPEAYVKTISAVISTHKPRVVLTGYTSIGMEIGPALSVRNEVPLVSFVSAITVSGGSISAVSQLYGGKMNVESVIEGSSVVLSILPGMFPADAGKQGGSPAVENFAAPDLGGLSVTFRKLIAPEAGDVDITAQDVLVSVGRGIQSEENLPLVKDLAARLGGAVSCSRPLVDSKWMPKTRQVGKSGLKVKPRLYLALGISGAPEHIEGMKDAGLIIAVNSDPKAPIFDYAHYGVVGDLFDLIPAMSEKL